MATQLDEKIEQLQNIVERLFDLQNVKMANVLKSDCRLLPSISDI
jgi:hypothetical protein